MANDIMLAINSNSIKNGTMIVHTKTTGPTPNDLYNRYVKNYPTITNIQNKYEFRFDDPSYYYGNGGGADGGDVGDVLGV